VVVQALRSRAAQFLKQSHFAEARDALREAVRLSPSDPHVRYELGTVLLRLRDGLGASRELQAAVQLSAKHGTDSAEIRTSLGISLMLVGFPFIFELKMWRFVSTCMLVLTRGLPPGPQIQPGSGAVPDRVVHARLEACAETVRDRDAGDLAERKS